MRSDSIQVFETLVAFNGDCQKAAVALNLTVHEVRGMLVSNNWGPKIDEWNSLKSGSTQNVSVQVNRAVNFVQAHRLRSLVDKVVGKLSEMEPDELMDLLSTKQAGKSGDIRTTFSARQLTDLVKAAESCHLMTQRALGDTAAEQEAMAPGQKGSSIALMVQAAMTAAEQAGVSSVDVVREQLKLATPPVQAS